MALKWLLYEVSNVNESGKADYGYNRLSRKFSLFDDFDKAAAAMKTIISSYAKIEGKLFDGAGNLKGINNYCDLLTECEVGLTHPGEYCDDFDDRSSLFISNLPQILRDFFNGKEIDDQMFPEDIDTTLPFILQSEVEIHYEELDGSLVLGNIDSSYDGNCFRAPYLFPSQDEDTMIPRFEINAFNMSDPNMRYFCRVTGECLIYDNAAPFLNIELVKIEE